MENGEKHGWKGTIFVVKIKRKMKILTKIEKKVKHQKYTEYK